MLKTTSEPVPNKNNGSRSVFNRNDNNRPIFGKNNGNSEVDGFDSDDVKYVKKSGKSKSQKTSKS